MEYMHKALHLISNTTKTNNKNTVVMSEPAQKH